MGLALASGCVSGVERMLADDRSPSNVVPSLQLAFKHPWLTQLPLSTQHLHLADGLPPRGTNTSTNSTPICPSSAINHTGFD